MDKRASNATDVSPVNDVTRQQIIPRVGDMSATLEAHLSICSLR